MRTKSRLSGPIRWALAATALLVAQSLASADSTNSRANVPQSMVSFSDLNLSDPADAAQLYKRLRRAARAVCGTDPIPLDLRIPKTYPCRVEALARAVKTLNHPLLTAHHEAQTGSLKTAAKRYANPADKS